VLPQDHPDRKVEQPGMYVSPETLALHLRVLAKHFEVMDLGEWVRRRLTRESLPERACCITFDDGWRDNYEFAFPILRHAGVPATIFVVADAIGSEYEFWPNRLARLLVDSSLAELPESLRELFAQLGVSHASVDPRLTMAQVDAIITACKSVPDVTMYRVLKDIDAQHPERTSARSLLSAPEIDEMARCGSIRFGSHGRRHLRLIDSLTAETVREEVVESRAILRKLTGQSVDLFCYPNGDHSTRALEMVRRTYSAAVATDSGWNDSSTDLHLLQRISVHEDIAADELSFLARTCCLA
jgi:peptidoglycan/xylan/chitin deacetylase (PgdA/CDA1 family)